MIFYPSSKVVEAMSRTQTMITPSQDPLGEVLHLLKPTGTLYCQSELRTPWAIDMPPMSGCMMFHIVTEGECWLWRDGVEPLHLSQGSLTLVPHGHGHTIGSQPLLPSIDLFDIPVERVSERYETMRHGGEGEMAKLTCCVVRFDPLLGQQLLALLPKVLYIDGEYQDKDGWLQNTLRFIAQEAAELRPGGEMVITHLADILLIQAIRTWIDGEPANGTGWLAAIRDERMGRALAIIHRSPEKPWSVAALAKAVGMSRSGFSARFSTLLGESVMQYLTRWRMQLAYQELKQGNEALAVMAQRFGYQSEAAFCRAFKRVFGSSPGQLRQSHKQGMTGDLPQMV